MPNPKQFIGVLLSVLICVFLVFLGVYATTTISSIITVSSDGTASAPAISFADDTDTGIYRIGADNLGFSVLATRAFSIIGHANGPNIIGGHPNNAISGTGYYSSVIAGGGLEDLPNTITDSYWSFIGGGEDNRASSSQAIVISGGEHNEVSSGRSTIAGGAFNQIHGNTGYSVIGGGTTNQILVTDDHPTNNSSAILGGGSNTIYEDAGFIGGGYSNAVIGHYGVVPGGAYNIAGHNYTFAAGRKASVSHEGAFVWADSTDAYFESEVANEVAFRAGGGMRLVVAGSNDLFRVFDGSDEIFTILDGGNVGINDTSPGYKLSVDGTASISEDLDLGEGGNTITTGTASVSGSCTIGDIYFRAGTAGIDNIISICDETDTWSPADL